MKSELEQPKQQTGQEERFTQRIPAETDEAFAERLIAIRRHLHRYPELSGEEKNDAAIRGWLEEEGVRIADEYSLRTGLVAEIGQGDGPVVALRADIDALPIQEETKLEFASQAAGKMHACGHDAHTAILVGAARLLKQRESGLPGKVRLLFQPSEEKQRAHGRLFRAERCLTSVPCLVCITNRIFRLAPSVSVKEHFWQRRMVLW